MSSTPTSEVVGHIQIPVPVTLETIQDILTTACEGGITPWCCKAVARDAATAYTKDFEFQLYDAEDGKRFEQNATFTYRPLNLENMLLGIGLWLSSSHSKGYRESTGAIDAGFMDANDADNIVQFAVFGEVVFG